MQRSPFVASEFLPPSAGIADGLGTILRVHQEAQKMRTRAQQGKVSI